VVFKSGDFMKKLILLATLFLLTSCDAITGAKPKPSATATPLASESPDPNAPIASGTTGAETPGPTTNGLPSPSSMPTNPVTAGNSVLPPAAPPTSVAGNVPLNPGINQPPVVRVPAPNSATDLTKPKPGTKLPLPSGMSPDQNSIATLNGDPANTKENSKDPKAKNGKGVKGAKGVDQPADSSFGAANPNTDPAKKVVSPQTIAEGGIGAAKVGMTLAELKKNLKNSARFETQTDFAPGYNAVAVKQQGKVQFYIPYPKNQKVTGNEQIKFLVTDNPLYKTAEGVSPGMSIKKATAIYGGAQLAFNPKAKVEEIVAFANQPGDLRFFSSGAESNGRAGIYPKKTQEQGFVTDKFGESGKIKRITVICPESVCASNQP
jgi:hypothetical protein